MRLLFLIFFLFPSLCFGNSQVTLSGKTAEAHIIQCNGVSLTPRAYLNFTTSGGSCTDANGKTNVPVGSGSGGGSVPGVTSLWSVSPGNVGIFTGTPTQTQNVGINTISPQYNLQVNGSFDVLGASNVGINSLSPGTTLDVQGTIRGLGIILPNGAQGQVIMQNSIGVGTWSTYSSGGSMTYPSGSGIPQVSSGSSWGSTLTEVDGDIIYGIGGVWTVQAPPTWNQNTSGTASNLSGTPSLPNGTTATTQSQADGSTKLATTSYVDTGLATKQATGSYLTTVAPIILASPNVGIGSVTPGQVLDVNGTLRAIAVQIRGGTSSQFLKADGSTDSTSYLSANPSLDTVLGVGATSTKAITVGTEIVNGTGLTVNGNVGIPTTTVSGNLTLVSSQFLGTGNANIGIGTITTTNFTMNKGVNAGYVMVGSSVGLGTWMPSTTLNTPIVLTTTGTSGASTLTGNALNIPQYTSGTGTNYWLQQASGNVGIYTLSPYGVGIGTSTFPTQGLVVMGNVGIGSVTPGQKLDVQGTIRSSLGAIFNGNVGIGTNSPPNQLFVFSSGEADLQMQSGSNTAYGGFGTKNDIGHNMGFGFGGSATGDFDQDMAFIGSDTGVLFATNNASLERMVITTAGNVGIGSATPGQTLDVQGTVRNLGEIINGNIGIGTTFTSSAVLSIMSGNVGIGTWVPGALLQVGNASASGNVGVGTFNPGEALDVNGGIRFNGNLRGGATGNVGIGTYLATAATCDSICNSTHSLRCFIGFKNSTVSGVDPEPCSASITGFCLCLAQ